MSERTISTRLVLDGEREYRQAMKGITAEYKAMKAEMDLVKAQYAQQQNSLQALQAKHTALSNVMKTLTDRLHAQEEALRKSVQQQQEFSQKAAAAKAKIEEKKRALEQLKRTTGDTSAEEDKLEKEIEELTREYNKNVNAAQKCEQNTIKYKTEVTKTTTELTKYDKELQKNDKYLDEAQKSSDGLADSIDETGKEMSEASEESSMFEKALSGAFGRIASMGVIGMVIALLKAAASAISDCVNVSIQFESAMAGVAKTTDLTDEELKAMGEQILELSTHIPIAATEFASIVETAGQLGVAKEDLVEFAKVMANLGVATNMTAEEAATMLAQFTAVTGMDPKFYSNLGAAVVALGNNFATTEQQVVTMSQRIASAGANAGMSEPDILALATAVSSVGIQAEAGGTAISTLISQMQTAVETGDNLDLWAEACGMSMAELAATFEVDATRALLAFIQGVNDTEIPLSVLLKELGLSDKRISRIITSMANAEDESGIASRAIGLSNDAWAENNALTQEAQTRYETLASKIQIMENQQTKAKEAFGEQFQGAVEASTEHLTDYYEALERLGKNSAWQTIGDTAGSVWGHIVDEGRLAFTFLDQFLAKLSMSEEEYQSYKDQLYAHFDSDDFGLQLGKVFRDAATDIQWYKDIAADLDVETVQRLSDQYDNFDETLAEWADQGLLSANVMAYLAEKAGELETSTEGAADAAADFTDADKVMLIHLKTSQNELTEIVNKYNEYRDAAKNTAESIFGLWNEVEIKWSKSSKQAEKSTKELISNMQSQEEYWQRYTDNIYKAMEEGIDLGLVLKLSDGSKESAKILDDIVNSSGTTRDQLVQEFQSVNEGTDAFADAVATLRMSVETDLDDIQSKMDQTVANMDQSANASAAASATMSAYCDELESWLKEVQRIADKISAAGTPHVSHGSGGSSGGDGGAGEYASGLEYVPYDEFPALLHKGEMVLTRFEAEAYRAAERTGTGGSAVPGTYNVSPVVNGTFYVRSDQDVLDLSEQLADQLARKMRYRGAALMY